MTYKQVLKYHEETKHHHHRYARSPGFMDWKNQPNPFRTYVGVPQIELPFLDSDPPGCHSELYRRDAASRPITLETVGGLLELSLGLSAWKEVGEGSRWALRMNPSSGNLHPTESHLILPSMENCPAGVYHYNPFQHVLEQRGILPVSAWESMADHFNAAGFLIALTGIFWRESWKYGERAWRYCHLDTGHALAGLSIAANLFGWKVTVLSSPGDRDLEKILGLDQVDWRPLEEEYPELICYVHPCAQEITATDLPRELISEMARVNFSGAPNLLSKEKVNWEIIYETAAKAQKPSTHAENTPLPDNPLGESAPSSPLGAATIIRQRRSGQAFDSSGSITTEVLLSMLDKTLPRSACAPFDAEAPAPRINLMLFVHSVTGLPQGLYMFIRNPAHREVLQGLCRSDFLWQPMISNDHLYLLEKGSFRTDAMSVSCGQEIAGFSAFSLGMIVEFGSVIEAAPYKYRHLFREAGMIGQVLYLEAEAFGVRGTGIGCFLDDAVHDLLGLQDNTFQSLYHFTVGKPVEDRRLITRAPYFHLKR
jgi:SagB-type dehydrogenase family enzyme